MSEILVTKRTITHLCFNVSNAHGLTVVKTVEGDVFYGDFEDLKANIIALGETFTLINQEELEVALTLDPIFPRVVRGLIPIVLFRDLVPGLEFHNQNAILYDLDAQEVEEEIDLTGNW